MTETNMYRMAERMHIAYVTSDIRMLLNRVLDHRSAFDDDDHKARLLENLDDLQSRIEKIKEEVIVGAVNE